MLQNNSDFDLNISIITRTRNLNLIGSSKVTLKNNTLNKRKNPQQTNYLIFKVCINVEEIGLKKMQIKIREN